MGWMNRSAEGWSDDLEDKPVKTIFKWIGIIFGICVVLTVAVWGIGVGLSWWGGQGDAYQQKNSAQNWVSAQKEFHQDQNDVTSDQANIATAKKTLSDWQKANPAPTNDPIAYTQWSQQETNYQTAVTGPQQACRNSVQDYNTASESYLTEDWKDAGLPITLDTSLCN